VYESVRDTYCQEMLQSALALAAQGIAVFPIKYRTKKPDTWHGFKDATTNPATIRRWFCCNFQRNLGARTGQASGVWVFDADNLQSLSALEEQHGPLPITRQSQSSRGLHFWFATPILPLQSSKSRIGPGLDVQSDGNYVVAPPSVHPDGPSYRWVNDAPIVEAPSWLLVLARKPAPPRTPTPAPSAPRGASARPGAYGAAALRSEIETLANTANGSRNHALNRASFVLTQLVAGGELDASDVERSLVEAAVKNGLVDDDGLPSVMATIRSGARAGLQHPRNCGRAA
jgi:Bifunctional DNA primase/polymerase, N-terminal